MQNTEKKKPLRLPEWFKQSKRKNTAIKTMADFLDQDVPNTICQEAKCPNRGECFAKGVLTFLVLGTVCTRNCAFCSVRHGKPLPPDPNELQTILHAIEKLNLRFVVLTSPNRDDLPDGGALHYVNLIEGIHHHYPNVKVEVLIPDFQGMSGPLDLVIKAKPDVINHNLETVPSLYTTVRKGSLYQRSLDLLSEIKQKQPKMLTKTGLMLGLGEEEKELKKVFKDIANTGTDILTLGQYLKPGRDNADVKKFYHPDEFAKYKEIAESLGIRYVFSGPLIRSSYLAEHVFDDLNLDI